MQIVQNGSTPGHGTSLHDQRRRHDHLTRRVTYAREAGLLEARLSAKDKSKVTNAAKQMVAAYTANRISRQQIEEEQRADETRLKGWQVVAPQPGTLHEDEIGNIRYRMAVRARALEEIASLDLAVLISSNNRERDALPRTKSAKMWSRGSGLGGNGAKAGGAISRTR